MGENRTDERENKLNITDENWSYGSYPRESYKKDMLYTFYRYKDFLAEYSFGLGRFSVCDRLARQMEADGLLGPDRKQEYEEKISCFLSRMQQYDSWPAEQIYGQIQKIRMQVMGTEALKEEWFRSVRRGCSFEPSGGIDQSQKKQEIFDSAKAVLLALCQPELFFLMRQDMQEAKKRGCRIYLMVSGQQGSVLPTREQMEEVLDSRQTVSFLTDEDENLGIDLSKIAWDRELQRCVDTGQAGLLVYGEEGLMHCRNLRVDSVVCAVPSGYFAAALTNQLDGDRACVVYVPRHFDIIPWVGLTEKTKTSYWQLAKLWEDFGDEIYNRSVPQLYREYPQYFLNIYENGSVCPEAESGYPLQIRWPGPEDGEEKQGNGIIKQYYGLRDCSIREYLNRQGGLSYVSAYFDEALEEREIPWCCQSQQGGILVQGVRTARAEKARVIRCISGKTLRQQLEEEDSQAPLRIFSNFLFFLTPKLSALYNELRADRPREQIDFSQGHLDYMLYDRDGKRVETFPLYRKACIAKKRDGRFLFFSYRLGGGSLWVAGQRISWTAADVDPQPGRQEDPVRIYTPYGSRRDQACDTKSYRLPVGEGRVNLVIIQDRILCIRKGEVILPSIGVVVSLDGRSGEVFLEKTGRQPLEDGYYDSNGLEFTVMLEGPTGIPSEEWDQVEWAYGGGMSMIADGQSIWHEDGCDSRFEEEGWLSPLSRQTQESEIHKPARHPRTAIGIAKNGDLFILVFSGRTLLSVGAQYSQVCRIAEKMFSDIRFMMCVDGGGSSVLGMAVNGNFMELSYPATSNRSCAGMIRQINTVFCLE